MKQLTCEMCGSTNLMKQDGVFVCQSCGTKYSVEEAKKMMVEGVVDVQGTVKVDSSDRLNNLYVLAHRAKDEGNEESAAKYYDQISIEDPDSWEAQFYKVYFTCMQTTIANMSNACVKLSQTIDSTFKLIEINVTDVEKQDAYFEIIYKCTDYANMVETNIYSHVRSYSNPEHMIDFITKQQQGLTLLRVKIGDSINSILALNFAMGQQVQQTLKELALTNYKICIENKYIDVSIRNSIIERIKKLEPSYEPPQSSQPTGGCYVATAVYGSYDCPQVWTLRRYRDCTLSETWYGRVFIHIYYAISPTLVKCFGHTEWFKKMWKSKLDRMVANLNAAGVKNTPYDDRE